MAYIKAILLLGLLVLLMSSDVFGRELAEESVQATNVKENGYGHGGGNGYGGGSYGHGGHGGGYGHGGHGGGYGHGGHGGGYGHGGHGGGYGGGRGGHPHKQGSTETEN